jgi:hypothetical protein
VVVAQNALLLQEKKRTKERKEEEEEGEEVEEKNVCLFNLSCPVLCHTTIQGTDREQD